MIKARPGTEQTHDHGYCHIVLLCLALQKGQKCSVCGLCPLEAHYLLGGETYRGADSLAMGTAV